MGEMPGERSTFGKKGALETALSPLNVCQQKKQTEAVEKPRVEEGGNQQGRVSEAK